MRSDGGAQFNNKLDQTNNGCNGRLERCHYGQLTFNAYNNAPISQLLITQLQACAAQLSPGAPLDELNDAISQLQWAASNNAPVGIAVINELSDVLSQLLNGTLTTNPPDVDAISQLTSAILVQEPGWANRLWMNWDNPSTTLTVQVRGLYTLTMIIAEIPWSTHWDNWTDAATDVVLQLYGELCAAADGRRRVNGRPVRSRRPLHSKRLRGAKRNDARHCRTGHSARSLETLELCGRPVQMRAYRSRGNSIAPR